MSILAGLVGRKSIGKQFMALDAVGNCGNEQDPNIMEIRLYSVRIS